MYMYICIYIYIYIRASGPCRELRAFETDKVSIKGSMKRIHQPRGSINYYAVVHMTPCRLISQGVIYTTAGGYLTP